MFYLCSVYVRFMFYYIYHIYHVVESHRQTCLWKKFSTVYCPAHYPSSKFVKTHFLCWDVLSCCCSIGPRAWHLLNQNMKVAKDCWFRVHTTPTWSPTVLAHVCSQKRATPTSATDYCFSNHSRLSSIQTRFCVWTLMASQIHHDISRFIPLLN